MSSESLPPNAAVEFAALNARLDQLSVEVKETRHLVNEVLKLVGPFAAPMPDGRMLVQSLHGQKYLIDPNDLIMAPQLIVYRQWEPELSWLFRRLVGPNSLVVDVGANFGYFTCLAAAFIGDSGAGRVIAVEPNPQLMDLLRSNITINWSLCPVDLHQAAAAAAPGKATLFMPTDRAANASLTALPGEKVRQFEVDLVVLDDLVPADRPVDILKIDVEGHEAGVLAGAKGLIARSPGIIIIMEWSIAQMQDAGAGPSELLKAFRDLDLAIFSAPEDGMPANAKPLDEATLAATPYTNIILQRR